MSLLLRSIIDRNERSLRCSRDRFFLFCCAARRSGERMESRTLPAWARMQFSRYLTPTDSLLTLLPVPGVKTHAFACRGHAIYRGTNHEQGTRQDKRRSTLLLLCVLYTPGMRTWYQQCISPSRLFYRIVYGYPSVHGPVF